MVFDLGMETLLVVAFEVMAMLCVLQQQTVFYKLVMLKL